MTVQIIMATYNGEKYIREQIESIISQTFSNWELIIHDDGSTDRTLKIVSEFTEKDSRIHLLKDNIKFHNSSANFFHLLKSIDNNIDYICLCDQDDIWLPQKLEKSIAEIEIIEKKDIPVCLATDVCLIDSYGKKYVDSFWNYANVFRKSNFRTLFLENTATGCTMIFNAKVLEYINELKEEEIKNIIQHDWFIALICASDGIYKQIGVPLVCYRQHESNVVGARKTCFYEKLNPKEGVNSLKRIKLLKKRILLQLNVIVNTITNDINKKSAKNFLSYNFLRHKIFCIRYGVYKSSSISKLLIKVLFY